MAGDAVAATGGDYTFADKNAGVGKTISVSGVTLSGADAGNYTLSLPTSAVADILRTILTGTISVDNKTYDGTAAATGNVTLTGIVTGDTVSATGGAYAFVDKNAGASKAVAVSGVSLSGADAGNYSLALPTSTVADILQKALTGTISVDNKTYDGTTAATGGVALSGLVAGDDVSVGGGTYAFADKSAGDGKVVSVSDMTLSGADAGNYTLTLPTSAVADILRRTLIGTVSVANKVYDSTTAATGSISLTGVVGDDIVTVSGGTYAFADKNAGTGKTVSVSGSALSGADAGNYMLTLPTSAIADILRKVLIGTISIDSKTYDGTTDANGNVSLTGVLAGDDVTAGGGNYAFADKNAGTGKIVSVSNVTLSGVDADNYTLTLPVSTVADILARQLTITLDDKSKNQGAADPEFTTTLISGSIVADDQLAGAPIRASGEEPGRYAIEPGSLTLGPNYQLTFRNGTLTIVSNSPPLPTERHDDILTQRFGRSENFGRSSSLAVQSAPVLIPALECLLLDICSTP